MPDDGGTAAEGEALRRRTVGLMDGLTARAPQWELPQPPAALPELRERLASNRYQVLVVGEAKRGKSSFVNALIGRDLLPTDVDVATSQVFRLAHAEQESYRVRFEDDSTREIGAEELPRYGSQALTDAGETPQLDRIVRWIE